MNKNENAQARKVLGDHGFRECQDGRYRSGSNTAVFSNTGASVKVNGSTINSVADLNRKLNK